MRPAVDPKESSREPSPRSTCGGREPRLLRESPYSKKRKQAARAHDSGSHPLGTNKALDSAHFRDRILAKQARVAFAKGRAMKGSRWWLAIALILVLAVSLSADGLRYWQGELYDLGQVVPRVGQQRLEAAESLPEGTTLPGLRSSRPAFFLIQLGEKDDEPFAAVADVSGRLQADDAVYVDVDRDGDLAEETAVRVRPSFQRILGSQFWPLPGRAGHRLPGRGEGSRGQAVHLRP